MGHGDYSLAEFVSRLAEVEMRFAKELQAVVECFVQSRVDLPAKALEAIPKTRARRARNLKKAVDPKKTDGVNLWKIANVVSASCVDEDEGMRDVRAALKKYIRKEAMKIKMNGEDVSTYRRVADDYRPMAASRGSTKEEKNGGGERKENRRSPAVMDRSPAAAPETTHSMPKEEVVALSTAPTDVYDVTAPQTAEEKQRWLEMWRAQVEKEEREKEEARRRLDKRQSMKIFGSSVKFGNLSNKLFGGKAEKKPALGSTDPRSQQLKAELCTADEVDLIKEPMLPPPRLMQQSPRVDDSNVVMKF